MESTTTSNSTPKHWFVSIYINESKVIFWSLTRNQTDKIFDCGFDQFDGFVRFKSNKLLKIIKIKNIYTVWFNY